MAPKRKKSPRQGGSAAKQQKSGGDDEVSKQAVASICDKFSIFHADTAFLETTPPGLLTIPPELRNRIYEEVLVEEKKIDLSHKDTKPPGLLSTCRQIRDEARKIWYFQNKFHLTVIACDCRLERDFADAREAVESEVGSEGREVYVSVKLCRGDRDWSNLLEWCRLIFAGDCLYALDVPDARDSNYFCVVATAQDVTKTCVGNWEDCRKTLESLRQSFGRINPMWLRD